MYEIKKTDEFESWFVAIRDPLTRGRLLSRLRKVSLGSIGDVAPIANGAWEMREHFGAGWRMYYVQRKKTIILMLGGGCKSTQVADINRVKKLLSTLED
jgi:putative addiction module killer protein